MPVRDVKASEGPEHSPKTQSLLHNGVRRDISVIIELHEIETYYRAINGQSNSGENEADEGRRTLAERIQPSSKTGQSQIDRGSGFDASVHVPERSRRCATGEGRPKKRGRDSPSDAVSLTSGPLLACINCETRGDRRPQPLIQKDTL